MRKAILSKSGSSSGAVLAAERKKSPTSEQTKLGITVSRSITHNTLSSISNSMLLTFVSQWQIRFGNLPSRYRRSARHISSASFSMAATASRNCCRRNSILWKLGIVSPKVSGISASIASNSPNFKPTR